jgi:hypothetical protein
MELNDLLQLRRVDILRIAAEHGASNVRVFGSVACGESGPDSDLDLLVEFDLDRSLFDHVALIQDLEDLLGRKVDVVTEDSLHWYIRDRVIAEAIAL